MAGVRYEEFQGHDGQYDAIVVGSGMGGLSVGALLAREGKKVLLLEKHYTLGGYTHTFGRMGYSWDVGLHYVGHVHIEGTTLNKVFRYVSDEKLEWAPLDDAYDRALFGKKQFDFVGGRENLRKKLKEYFPAEKDHQSIDKYFQLLDEVLNLGNGFYVEKALPPFLAKLIGGWLRKPVMKYSEKTTLEVLESLTDNVELIGVLTAQYGDYGMFPSESSFYMHAMLVNHYIEGAGYPIGGSNRVAEVVVEVIEAAGGKAVKKAEVMEVVVEGNKAIGVKMADGKVIKGKKIISNTGVIDTFSRLIPEQLREKHQLDKKVEQLRPSEAHVALYAGVKATPTELKLPRCNYWVFQDEYDHQKSKEHYKSLKDQVPMVYISFPKDPKGEDLHPGKATMEAVAIVPYSWFDKWQGTEWRRRGDEYNEMKKVLADQLLERIYRATPQLKDRVDYFEVSTPLSTTKFMGHSRGEMYGVSHGPDRFRHRFLRPHTPVKNLFMTGQDVMITSISGALMGGVLCASAILKKDMLKKVKKIVK